MFPVVGSLLRCRGRVSLLLSAVLCTLIYLAAKLLGHSPVPGSHLIMKVPPEVQMCTTPTGF